MVVADLCTELGSRIGRRKTLHTEHTRRFTWQLARRIRPNVNAKSLLTRKWEALKSDRGERTCLTSSGSLPVAEQPEFPETVEAGEGLELSVHQCSSTRRKEVRTGMRQTQGGCGSWVERRLVQC